MMNEIFLLILSLSISGSFVALCLFLLKPIIKHRLSKTWQYYIYLIVIVRLLFPFSFDINFVGTVFQQAENYIVTESSPAPSDNIPSVPSPHINETPDKNTNLPNTVQTNSFVQLILSLCWLVWMIPAAVFLARNLINYILFIHKIKTANKIISDPVIKDIYNTTYQKMRIKHPPSIVQNSEVATPMLVGLLRPTIILPNTVLTHKGLRYILQHELTHYKRFDIGYKWLIQIALCFHWFNPIIYWVSREINHNCELSCDETVIRQLDKKNQRAYGNMLLETITLRHHPHSTAMSVTLSEDAKLIKERLGAIMKFKKKQKSIILLSVFLAAVLLCGSAFSGGYNWERTAFTSAGKDRIQFSVANNLHLDENSGELLNEQLNKPSQELPTADSAEVPADQSYEQPAEQNFTFEQVDIRRYEGDDGHPYIHDIEINNTNKTIAGYERGMLAFDENGKPLEIDWWSLDTNYDPSYLYLYSEDVTNLAPQQRDDPSGGFSLNFMGIDPEVEKIAYILYCIKEITFEDGTLWSNPDYNQWLDTYQGKTIDLNILNNYYPYVQPITFN